MESSSANPRARRQALLAAALVTAALALAGCGALGYTSAQGDKTKGKTLFQSNCGGCHTLADAGTTGTIGPDLDHAFQQALAAGMTEATIRQVVRGQIAYAIDHPSSGSPGMPKNIVEGADARDVATYVASTVAREAAAGGPSPAATPGPSTTTTTQTTTTPASGGSTAQIAAGKKVFTGAGGCGSCHKLTDAGTAGTVGPDLDNLKADAQKAGKPLQAYVQESIVDPNAYVVPGFPKGVMPPDFKSTLKAPQLAALIAYLVSLSGG